ncbi:MAG: hypothetical protein ABSE84_18860, partial [Isosphaeraceae bacterium]
GVLLRPQKPRQVARKSRGGRPVFLLSPPFFKSAKRELREAAANANEESVLTTQEIRDLVAFLRTL